MKLFEIKELKPVTPRNFVAKHARNTSGAGRHVAKKGEKAPRVRQKRQWKRDIRSEI